MDFFERQDQARRNTKLLVIYFILGVLYGRAILPVSRSAAAELKALCRSTIATMKME